MGLIMWLFVGGVIGWLAILIMQTDGSQGIVANILVGIVGAFIGGMILSRGDINNAPLTVTTFLVSLAGAVLLLAVVFSAALFVGAKGSGHRARHRTP